MHSFVLWLLLAWNTPAQEQAAAIQNSALTLPKVEAEALANNPEIQSLAQYVGLAEARANTATGIEDPEFMYRNWGTPLLAPWNLNQSQHMFMFSQKFPARSKRELRYLIAAADAEIRALEVEAKKGEILGKVRRAFYQLLRSYDQLRLHHEQVTLAGQAVAAVRIKYTVGKAPQQDVLKAQIAYSRLRDHELMFQQEADIARAELNALMGREPDQPLDVEGEYRIMEQLPSQQQLQELAIQNRPELRAWTLMKSQGSRKIQLAEKGYSPEYTVSTGYMLMPGGPGGPGGSPHRNAWMAELSVSLPWLNRGTHDAEIREAEVEAALVESEYRKQAASISREIREALIRLETAKQVVELYRDTLRPQALSTLRATVAAYQTDQTDFINLIDSQSMAIDFQHAFFEALENYEKSLADLTQAIGAPLPNITQARGDTPPAP